MRSSLLASQVICASSALASQQDLFSTLPGFGICRDQTHNLQSGFSDGPICSSRGSLLSTKFNDDEISFTDRDGVEDALLAPSSWPITTPCARNGSSAEYCIYSDPSFANGHGITLLTNSDRASRLRQSSVFEVSSSAELLAKIERLNEPENPKWVVQHMPGKGMGVIATQKLELGDHIMSDSPSMMIDYGAFDDLKEQQYTSLQALGIVHLPPHHRSQFLNLSTHDAESMSRQAQVDAIININAFDIEHAGEVSEEGKDLPGWYAVFPHISRMNHDCRPNADYYFDPVTFTQHVHAVRPIAPGEEITISYIDTVQTRADRHARIESSWHFTCTCPHCTKSPQQTAASDARLNQIISLRARLNDYTGTAQTTPALGELMISLFQQENLWSTIYKAYTYAAIEYNSAGEPWLATTYAQLAVQHGLATSGPGDNDVVEMKRLAKDPWGHWSWLLRNKTQVSEESELSE